MCNKIFRGKNIIRASLLLLKKKKKYIESVSLKAKQNNNIFIKLFYNINQDHSFELQTISNPTPKDFVRKLNVVEALTKNLCLNTVCNFAVTSLLGIVN